MTFDLDFGEMFYFSKEAGLWVIILKLKNQTVESVNRNLQWLLDSKVLEDKNFKDTLMLVEEGRVKVRRRP